jgi:predicted ferric reductase
MTPLAATLGPTAFWYLTRATGVVALLLLTAIIVLGVLGPMRVAPTPRWPRFALDTLHRDLSLLAVAVIAIHVITTVLDGFAPIGLIDAVVPLHSAYRSLWLGLGAFAFDLMLALIITSLVRRRLGYRSWRLVHWLAYASWPAALLHGLGTGSDTKQVWSLAITFACVVAVAVAVIARARRGSDLPEGLRAAVLAVATVTPVGVLAFTIAGPLAAHWAERAGTPTTLLAAVHPTAATHPATPPATTGAASTPLRLPFTGQLTGRYTQSQAGGGAILDFELRVSGGVDGTLRIRLGGQPVAGGLSMTGSQVDLLAAGLPSAMQGKVTTLNGSQVAAHLTGAPGRPLNLVANLQIDNQSGSVTGTITGRAA